MNRTVALASLLVCLTASSYATNEPRSEGPAPKAAEAHQDTSDSHETTPPAEGRALSPQNRSVEGLEATVTA